MGVIDRHHHYLQNSPDPSMLPIPVVSIAYRRVASWSDLRESGPAVCSTRSHLFWHEGPQISLYVRRYQTMSTLIPILSCSLSFLRCEYARHICARARITKWGPWSHLDGMSRAVRLKEERARFIHEALPRLHTLFLPSPTPQLPRIARDVHFHVLDLAEAGCFPSRLRQFELREIMIHISDKKVFYSNPVIKNNNKEICNNK